jgi:hypothetical protein
MNRRGFLGMLAGATLDPERLLWVPGRKLISIPRQRIIIDPLLAVSPAILGRPEGYGFFDALPKLKFHPHVFILS